MVFGGIDLTGSNILSRDIMTEIRKVLQWNTCNTKEIIWNEFSGTILFDRRLPVSEKDFCFIDNLNEILVILDGFIYNKGEIIRKYSLPENSLHLETPELLLRAFLKEGESFVRELNGDFAICIYDKKAGNIFFYRDHLGIRPLAVCKRDSLICFSTDIMGLCKALLSGERINPSFVINMFLLTGWDYGCMPLKDVMKILPGHYAIARSSGFVHKKYWHPGEIKNDKDLTFEAVKNDLETLLNDSVRIRSDRKFTASAHVSGGLDSGVVAALSRKEYYDQREFFGFSWSPDRLQVNEKIKADERSLVRDICMLHDMIPVYSNFTVDDFFDHMADWRNSLMIIYERKIGRAAGEKSINLIFSGWGGDEFISTGNRGIDADLIKEFNWGCFLKRNPLRKPKRIVLVLLFNVFFPSVRRPYLRYKADPAVYRFIKAKLKSNIIPRNRRTSYSSRRRVHLGCLDSYHIATRCEDWYVNGQRNGIEYRYPLLDKRIIEYMLKVPSHCLVDGADNRIIMRHLAKNLLPREVISGKSKEDPVKSYFHNKATKELTQILVDKTEDFRHISDLAFVNFDLLDRAIREYKLGNEKRDPGAVLFCLKWAHELIKGFYHH